ncbi:glycosyl hydrolase family 28-related protein [Escherichia marmotae]|nr:glycosyl hydrolase family 28-related protein [Escherichia marmotae]
MTVSTEVDHNEYTGNGVTTSFPYTFRIFKKSDLVVQVSDLNGNVTELVLDTGYTVTGAGTYSGGSVVLPSPLAAGWRITIDRVLDVVQETDLRNQGKFFPEVHEDAFDYLTMLIQQCFGWFRRALMKPSLLAKYYDAKQNRISNLADPSLEQDAVNNRSMRNYVDAAIAGVVGGFGWFIQYGSGAVCRTFQDKMRDTVSVLDFGAKGDGVTNDTDAFIAAASASPQGVYVPDGTYLLPEDINGRFYGPGKIIKETGAERIPFTNVAQSHSNLILGYDAAKNYTDSGKGNQLVLLGPSSGRNITSGTNTIVVGVGGLSGDTLEDDLTDKSPFSGTEIISIGINALKKATTGNNMIGIGRDALNECKDGRFNVAVGMSALQQLHSGEANVAIGRSAGMRTGIYTDPQGVRLGYNKCNGNTLIGNAAGRELKQGDHNTAIGNGALRGVSSTENPYTGTLTGNFNTAIGVDALNSLSSGDLNVMIGARAGRKLPTGNGNIFIGPDAGTGISEDTSNKFIVNNHKGLPFLEGVMGGAQAEDNYLRIDGSVAPQIDNQRTCGQSSRRWQTVFATNGVIQTSDGRCKDVYEISTAEYSAGLELAISMIKFKWTDAESDKYHFGCMAQEVMLIMEKYNLNPTDYSLVTYDKESDMYGVNYADLSCFCIAAMSKHLLRSA